MDPFTVFAVFVFASLVGDGSSKNEVAAKKKKLFLDARESFPEDTRPLFDFVVDSYQQTGAIPDVSVTYVFAREHDFPTEGVSKVNSSVRRLITEDALQKWNFRATPEYDRTFLLTTYTGHRVQMGRLVYVDVIGLFRNSKGVASYNQIRDYLEKVAPVLQVQYDDDTHEFWAWIPTPDNTFYATPLRSWNTIVRKWPDFVDPELARKVFPKRVEPRKRK